MCINHKYKIKCNRTTGKIEQEVAHSSGGCNVRCTLNASGEITSMCYIEIEEGSPVLGFRILPGALEWLDSVSGGLEWMDCYCWMFTTPTNNTLYRCKKLRLAKTNAHWLDPDTPKPDAPEINSRHWLTLTAGQMGHWAAEWKCVPLYMTPLNIVIMGECWIIWGDCMT